MPEGQTAFRMRNVVEEWPDAAAGLAARRLDLDHIGPEVPEELAAELAGFIRELEDPEAGQRTLQRLGIAHRSISFMYGKSARFTGHNVPSAKPARRSSWL